MTTQPNEVETAVAPEVDPSLVFSSTSSKAVDEERVPLFAIDGKTYTVPAKPRPTLALRYLRDLREVGETAAVASLLTNLLGREGFNALVDYDDLTMENFEAVVEKAQALILGASSEAAKN